MMKIYKLKNSKSIVTQNLKSGDLNVYGNDYEVTQRDIEEISINFKKLNICGLFDNPISISKDKLNKQIKNEPISGIQFNTIEYNLILKYAQNNISKLFLIDVLFWDDLPRKGINNCFCKINEFIEIKQKFESININNIEEIDEFINFVSSKTIIVSEINGLFDLFESNGYLIDFNKRVEIAKRILESE